MNTVPFIRATRFAWQNFWRNVWLSVVTIVILILTLFSITLSVGLNLVAGKAITAVKERVAVSMYFTPEALEEDVRAVQERLQTLPRVKEVQYISREDALAAFRERTANNPVVQETLETLGDNPLGATLVVKAQTIDDYAAVLDIAQSPEYESIIDDIDYEESQEVIARLTSITNRVSTIGLIVSLVFSVAAALVIVNTIRITIYSYREEIGIMKLVGATNWFVRAPFILESILYAVVAGIICLFLVLLLGGISAPYLDQFFAGYELNLVQYMQANIGWIFLFQLGVAIVLAMLSSLIAIGRHLKV